MKKVFSLLSLFILGSFLLNCGGSGGSASGVGATGTPSFESGPIDIPITIAKATNGIDPSSLSFDSETQILSGRTIDEAATTVGVYVSGALSGEVSVTSGNFEVTGIVPPVTLALAVLNTDGTASPVTVADINADGVLAVAVTNIAGIQATSRMAVTDTDIYFCANAVTSSGGIQPVIATVPLQGGAPEVVLSVDRCPTIMGIDGSLGGVGVIADTTSNEIKTLSSSTATLLGSTLSDNPSVALSEAGWGIAFTSNAANTDVTLNGTVLGIPADGATLTGQIIAWKDASTLASFQRLAGSFRLEEFNIDTGTATATTAYAADCSEITCGGGTCLLDCDDGASGTDAVFYDSGAFSTLNTDNYSNLHVCSSDIVIGQINAADDGDCNAAIGGFDTTSFTTALTGRRGCNPQCDLGDASLTHYFSTLSGTTQIFLVNNGISVRSNATKLAIAAATGMTAGTCSGAFTVTSQDSTGTNANVGGDVTVNLSGASNGGFYSDTLCNTAATTCTISNSSSSCSFYFKDNTAESPTIAAADNAGTLTGDTKSVTISANVASKFTLSTSTTASMVTCSSSFFAVTADNFGNESAISAGSTVNLTQTSVSGGATGTFYSNNNCTTTTTQATVAPGASTGTFYFKCVSSVGSLTITADDGAGGLTAGTSNTITCGL